MRIRQEHSIGDRIKLFGILLILLIVLSNLARIVHKEDIQQRKSSIEVLLKTALQPVGTTMYIWGGGWDSVDSASGENSTRIGLDGRWKKFAENQDASYNYKDYEFEREMGLDCSGFVGWVIYNTFEIQSGKKGYVTTSTHLAKSLAERGWGKLIKNPKNFLPGDIVSMEGHVWICLGTCEDGSVLLVHSSPPGVSMCGTIQKGKETEESMAVSLATEYMSQNHPIWQERYPNRSVSYTYLENVEVFRWSGEIMIDAETIQKFSAEEMIVYMSPDI